jgi:hypothetical protein
LRAGQAFPRRLSAFQQFTHGVSPTISFRWSFDHRRIPGPPLPVWSGSVGATARNCRAARLVMTARMYHENSKPQALPSKRNGLPRGQVSFPGVRGKQRWVAAVPLINEMVAEVRKRIPADAILLRASTGCLESDSSRPRARFRRASSRRRDATFTLATPLGAQALAMRGVLPTRLSAVVEAARMDVLCAAPPLADGASAASWRNHLATHGRTLNWVVAPASQRD